MIDKANFYKLPKEEQNNEKLWENASPDVKQFADNLVEAIRYSDTPFVLGIDGGYGTGKTYFSTRFTEYLKEKDINAIYCSVWENDYLKDPFIAISKELRKYFKSINNIDIIKVIIPIIKVIDPSVNLDFVDKWELIKIAIKKIFSKIDYINEFKEKIKTHINSLPNKKLVLIIDELDRCRPDFAVKTLEILKHLFDIEGLYVILMINEGRLNQHINAFYNIQVTGEEKEEGYLAKFINRYEHIPNLNYEVIVNELLTIDRLKEAIDKGNITEDETKFNSFKELKCNLIECCKITGITYRETKELIYKCIEFCNYYNEPIRCICLPYELIKNDLYDKTIIKDKLFKAIFINTKNEMIKLIQENLSRNYENKKCENWRDIEKSLIDLGYDLSLLRFGIKTNVNPEEKDTIYYYYEKLQLLGSDDNDVERMNKYGAIGKDFNKLYEKSKKQ